MHVLESVIVLSGSEKKASYYVKVEGDIAGLETVSVVPESEFALNSNNKASQIANITQDKIEWTINDFDTDVVFPAKFIYGNLKSFYSH